MSAWQWPEGWQPYGGSQGVRFVLLRHGSRAARWFDSLSWDWCGPEQRNVAPAVAWALECGPAELQAQERRFAPIPEA